MDLAQALVTGTAPVQRLCRTGWSLLVSEQALGRVLAQALGQASGQALVLVSVPVLEQALVPASEQELCRTGPLPSRTRRAEQAHKCGRPLC